MGADDDRDASGKVRLRRSVVLAVAVGLVATACGTTLGRLGSPDEPPVPPDAVQPPLDGGDEVRPPGEEDLPYLEFSRPDGTPAQTYARMHGVTPEEASEILDWQAAVNRRLPRVIARIGDRYALAELVHPDESEDGVPYVRVYVADPTPEDVAAVAGLPGKAVVVGAVGGRAELEALEQAALAEALANGLGPDLDIQVDPVTGEVTITEQGPSVEE